MLKFLKQSKTTYFLQKTAVKYIGNVKDFVFQFRGAKVLGIIFPMSNTWDLK